MARLSSVTLPASAYVANLGGMETGIWLDELTRYCQEVVSRAEELLRASGLTVESRVLQGDPRETLVEEAREQHADLIVVGSHGRTGLERLVMGSVASHVVTHAPCSVLVVRPEAK
jgi:nucleotide-binding universal stress UspA family protein